MSFEVEIVCDRHDRRRVVDTFAYAQHRDTEEMRWFWLSSKRIGGGGKLDRATGLHADWMEPGPSRMTVREDLEDGVPRVALRCRGHGDVGMPWSEFVSDYLEPVRLHDRHEIPLREIVSKRTNPTRRPRADA